MSSVLGPPLLLRCTAVGDVAGDGTDVSADAADAVTTAAASVRDQDDVLPHHSLRCERCLPPCSLHTHFHAQPAVYSPSHYAPPLPPMANC